MYNMLCHIHEALSVKGVTMTAFGTSNSMLSDIEPPPHAKFKRVDPVAVEKAKF